METIPVWYVIMTYQSPVVQFQVWRVLKSIPCTLADVGQMFDKEAAHLLQNGIPIQTMIFSREVDNPITHEQF